MSQLPYLPELLLLQKTPSSALCCFTGLARHSRRRDREPRDQPSMTDAAAEAAEAVQVYEPRSSLSGGLRRICSTEEPPPPPQSLDGRRSLSATLPSRRRQQPQLHLWSTLDLPSLLGSVLGWRNGGGRGDTALVDTRRRQSVPQSTTSRQQRRTWNFGDRSSTTVTAGSRADSRLDSVDGRCSIVEIASDNDSGANATAVKVTNGHTDGLGGALDNDDEKDDNSDIVDIYLDSILDSLPDTVDAAVADTDTAAAVDDAEIDIDELMQLGGGDTPIGESTARGGDEEEVTEASSPSEAELARGAEASAGQAEAAADGVVDAAATAAAAADASDGGDRRRLSDTGSELATDEFCYLRLRVLPEAGGSVRPASSSESPSTSSPPSEASPWPVDGRKRLHRRRQSYRMDSGASVGGRALPDWSGDGGPVLLSARSPPPPPPQPIPSLPPPPLDVVDAITEDGGPQCPRASSAEAASSQAARRAVVFHSAALAGRAAYLVNFLSSSGQPACRWSRLLRDQQRRRPRRSRLADRLCGRPQLQLADAKAALRLCASSGHLPIFLQPSAAEEDEGGKFVGQLRAALAELSPPPLTAGLVAVVVVSAAGTGADGDSCSAAATAWASRPTLTVVDATAPASSEPPGLDCCRAVLLAARQCASVAAAVAPRAAQTTDQQQCK